MYNIKNISMSYEKGKTILNDISFTTRVGKTTMVIGPNGAGKTSLISTMLGFNPITSGEILFAQKPINGQLLPEQQKLIGYIPDEVFLNNYLTVNENIEYFTAIINQKFNQEKVDNILKTLNISKYKNELAKNLSKGTKQKVQLASLLINEIKFIIMDEPTIGLDIMTKNTLASLINSMKKQGITFLITSHDLSFSEAIYDDAIFINEGRVIHNINNRNESLSNIISKLYDVNPEM